MTTIEAHLNGKKIGEFLFSSPSSQFEKESFAKWQNEMKKFGEVSFYSFAD